MSRYARLVAVPFLTLLLLVPVGCATGGDPRGGDDDDVTPDAATAGDDDGGPSDAAVVPPHIDATPTIEPDATPPPPHIDAGGGGCVPTGPELCGTGVDENCDGAIDEGFGMLGVACTTGAGACMGTGSYVCSADLLSVMCNATPLPPTTETCNGVDDDCDGVPDDGLGLGTSCDGPDPDFCMEGTVLCDGLGGTMCGDTTGDSTEICNGVDDNCDGVIDEGCGGGCAHSECTAGALLTTGCSSCATTVCGIDPFCCATSWDSVCVGEATSMCGGLCGGGGGCVHDKCVAGAALTSGCDTCVTSICASDSFCCATSWDSLCVGEVSSICGLTCP